MYSMISPKSIHCLTTIILRPLGQSEACFRSITLTFRFIFLWKGDKQSMHFNFQMCYHHDATPISNAVCSKPISTKEVETTRTLIGSFKNNIHATPPFKCFKSRACFPYSTQMRSEKSFITTPVFVLYQVSKRKYSTLNT